MTVYGSNKPCVAKKKNVVIAFHHLGMEITVSLGLENQTSGGHASNFFVQVCTKRRLGRAPSIRLNNKGIKDAFLWHRLNSLIS